VEAVDDPGYSRIGWVHEFVVNDHDLDEGSVQNKLEKLVRKRKPMSFHGCSATTSLLVDAVKVFERMPLLILLTYMYCLQCH
jgi:hypothetical protein